MSSWKRQIYCKSLKIEEMSSIINLNEREGAGQKTSLGQLKLILNTLPSVFSPAFHRESQQLSCFASFTELTLGKIKFYHHYLDGI